jgi:hypothetical protein
MLNEDVLFAYWESQNPRVDIRMLSDLNVSDGNVTVFSGKDRAAFSERIAKANSKPASRAGYRATRWKYASGSHSPKYRKAFPLKPPPVR